ncbi:PLP-dependent aminotransferase family protein [Chitinophaga oryzae]|uniref:PLP-dependent aminotransferase family protein n=1 Tax=Chitinophaga oryzae TaxID=2725414 RepID=A0AAE6ZCF2_9BACT|nr:PLP-dependent aminotransferase family protein [Chitinophaga oryzae]QJB30146.1 PLP-dependent aminotransferase family protein [Chitinophaga oryzae]QJB36644.1 PLP-dependent aminotransferase family protein [Chitinophaga oryzae]
MLRRWKITIQWDKKAGRPIYLQIADAVMKDIRSGRLQPGDALPGSRDLAQLLKVNRNTVVEALNELLTEGWIVSKERKGTFVAEQFPRTGGQQEEAPAATGHGQQRFSVQFDDGHPSSKIAPVASLARAYREIFQRKAKWQAMSYVNPYGETSFRKEIALMLNHQRGMRVRENDLCITRGSQMAMYLAAHCLFSKGDYVLVENPGYKPAWNAFESAGARLLPVAVDGEGLVIADVKKYLRSRKIKAVYITPHRQYPTTVTLSQQRRLELIRLSNEHGFKILEDDYDNEFHFGQRPVLPLCSFPELQHYVYIGTLSKVVAPALRIGYMVSSDRAMMERVGALRKIIDVQGDIIMEHAVLQLIKDGTIRRHIKKASHYYKTVRDITAGLLDEYLSEKTHYTVPEGGLAFWLVPRMKVDWLKLSESLKAKGVLIITPESFSYGTPVNGLRLGYAALSEEQLRDGIKVLSALL